MLVQAESLARMSSKEFVGLSRGIMELRMRM